MRALLPLAIGLSLSIAVPQALSQGAKPGRLFQCIVVSSGGAQEDGKFGPTSYTKAFDKISTRFVFDESSQMLRWEGHETGWQYRKLQGGNDQNSLIAIRLLDGSATVVVDVLRIQTWIKGWPFMLVEQDIVYTGTCKKF